MQRISVTLVSLVLLSILYSCHRPRSVTNVPVTVGSEMLYQYQWNLSELNGQSVAFDTTNNAHLLFSHGQVNKVFGSTGCNRLSGTFKLTDTSKIKFSPLITTKMACVGKDETPFLTALSEANDWSIVNNQLVLNNGKVPVAKFEGVPVGETK